MNPSPNLGQAVQSIRTDRGLSLAATSALTGMSVATLSKVENGKRTLAYDKLIVLAKALDVDISRLFNTGPAVPAPSMSGRRSLQHRNEGYVIHAGVYT